MSNNFRKYNWNNSKPTEKLVIVDQVNTPQNHLLDVLDGHGEEDHGAFTDHYLDKPKILPLEVAGLPHRRFYKSGTTVSIKEYN